MAKHHDRLRRRRRWFLERPHGGVIFARPVEQKTIDRLVEKGLLTNSGSLTYAGKKEGLRLSKLYVMGKI